MLAIIRGVAGVHLHAYIQACDHAVLQRLQPQQFTGAARGDPGRLSKPVSGSVPVVPDVDPFHAHPLS